MQNYTEIPSSTTLSDSLSQILNNDKTALSLSSGTSFPTVNLQQGMPCFRTDEQKLYILTVVSPATWKMVIDLSATVGKVANADLLDGIDSTAFVRSVNGYGPDANGNSSVPIDLSSRVAKSGDTMTGTLTVPRLQIASTANYLDMVDQDWGTRYLHHNQGLMGFLKSDGNWDMYMNNSGQMWTANYGWLHDYFFSTIANCFIGNCPGNTGNCSPVGNNATSVVSNCGSASFVRDELVDNGSQIAVRRTQYNFNCNCNCNCDCYC